MKNFWGKVNNFTLAGEIQPDPPSGYLKYLSPREK